VIRQDLPADKQLVLEYNNVQNFAFHFYLALIEENSLPRILKRLELVKNLVQE